MLAALAAGTVMFPAAAQASFCGVAGNSAQEIAANVLKAKDFVRVAGNARFVGYWHKKTYQMLIITRPGNAAHAAAACRRVTRRGDWQAWTTSKCQASRKACNAFLEEFKVLDAQWQRRGQNADSES